MMRTKIQTVQKTLLAALFGASVTCLAAAQWQIGEQVLSPPPAGDYYSMFHGTDWLPLPFPLDDVPVYYLGTNPGMTNNAFAYDDRILWLNRQATTQSNQGPPAIPGDNEGGGSGGDTNTPAGTPFNIGTNLYLLIGPTNVVTGSVTNPEAWLLLTNTHNPTFYQIQSRPKVVGAPWELGQILQDTGSSQQVRFNNVRRNDPAQSSFRAVGGLTVASIALDPDYNLAVEPASSSLTGSVGKFRISLNPTTTINRTVLYQISGSASNGVDYSSLGGSVAIQANVGSVVIDITPLYDPLPEFDESVTLTLVLTRLLGRAHEGQRHNEDL